MNLEILQRKPKTPGILAPLLFVHGVSHGAWCWERWADWFARRGRESQALGLRGHGASPGRELLDDFSLEDYGDDVLSVARSMAPPILVGHSMGGAVAQLVVAAAPQLFKGLVLLASVPPDGLRIIEMLPLLLQMRGLLNLQKIDKGRALTTRQVQTLPFFDGRISAAEADLFGARLQRESKKASRAAGTFRAPAFEAKLPTLVMGSARDRLLPVSALRRSARHYSGELIVLEAACHDIMLDPAWEDAAGRLDDWLTAHKL